MSKRRGRGEGSIYRRKDGLWVGQYKVQTPEGTKTKYIYSKTRKDAATRLAKAIAERDAGLVFDAGALTIGAYLERWLDTIRDTVKQRTWHRHEEVSRLHLKPALGNVRLGNLNALQVQSLYRAKLDSGLSPRTVQIIHATLHKALKQAVRWSLVPRNVAEAVNPPKPVKKEIQPLSAEQAKNLLKTAKETQPKLYALYVLAVSTGMRSGELLGLQWRDVDLRAGMLRVRRTVFNGKVNVPKTSHGSRGIRLSKTAVEALKQHAQDGEWIFPTSVGTSMSVHNLHNRSWKPLLKCAGLPNIRFHDLRHTCATLLLTKAVHPKVVQELLGHASIQITLDTYSHLLPDMGDIAASAMDSALA
jgi:integrase